MTIFIDDAAVKAKGRVWFHLMSDRDDDEIHHFGRNLGLKRHWFHRDHYDIPLEKRADVIAAGAIPTSVTTLVNIRRAKRRTTQKTTKTSSAL